MVTMSVDDRHRLYDRLNEVLGLEEARTLMQYLPAVAGAEVVTRSDLDAFGAQLRAELRADFAEFRGEMREKFAEFRGEVRAEIRGQVRTLLLSLLGLQISAGGVVVAVVHLT